MTYDYLTDGILIKLVNGAKIPLQDLSYVVFNRGSKADVVSGEALIHYEWVKSSEGYWEHFNSKLNRGDQDTLEQFNYWGNNQNYRYGNHLGSITITPRGGDREIVFDAREVVGFEFNYVPRTPKGIVATLRNGRKIVLASNQIMVFYNCQPERVSDRRKEYEQTKASWSNPYVGTIPYKADSYTTDVMNNLLYSGTVKSIQLGIDGDGGQLLYPAEYFVSFELV